MTHPSRIIFLSCLLEKTLQAICTIFVHRKYETMTSTLDIFVKAFIIRYENLYPLCLHVAHTDHLRETMDSRSPLVVHKSCPINENAGGATHWQLDEKGCCFSFSPWQFKGIYQQRVTQHQRQIRKTVHLKNDGYEFLNPCGGGTGRIKMMVGQNIRMLLDIEDV